MHQGCGEEWFSRSSQWASRNWTQVFHHLGHQMKDTQGVNQTAVIGTWIGSIVSRPSWRTGRSRWISGLFKTSSSQPSLFRSMPMQS